MPPVPCSLPLQLLVFVFVPAFDRQICNLVFADGINKGTGQTGIGNQRNAVINGASANGIPMADFTAGMVFWNIDYQVDFLFLDVFQRVGMLVCFIGPVQAC